MSIRRFAYVLHKAISQTDIPSRRGVSVCLFAARVLFVPTRGEIMRAAVKQYGSPQK